MGMALEAREGEKLDSEGRKRVGGAKCIGEGRVSLEPLIGVK